jgi:hypothetical protein
MPLSAKEIKRVVEAYREADASVSNDAINAAAAAMATMLTDTAHELDPCIEIGDWVDECDGCGQWKPLITIDHAYEDGTPTSLNLCDKCRAKEKIDAD